MKRKAATNNRRLLNELSNSNAPPSDERQLEIRARLGDLEAEFQRIVGRPFASNLAEKEIPNKAKSTWDAIQAHQSLLSPIRLVTPEIWQTIFQLLLEADEESDKAPNLNVLATLCRVARHWRSAAITHCRLWTRLPSIWMYSLKMQTFDKLKNCLRLFISRSGALPLTFQCSIYKGIWKSREDHVREILRLVIEQSHRWKEVSMKMPFDAHEELALVKGKLPMLSKLTLNVGHSYCTSKSQEITIDYFQDAPCLQTVDISARYVFDDTNMSHPKVIFKLPVSQLENYKVETHCDTVYSDLLEGGSDELRVVEVLSSRMPELPATPLTFSKLEKLDLRTGTNGSVITDHLEFLSFPALLDLEIRARFEPPDPLYDNVQSLIRRSGCSLTRLALDNVTAQADVLAGILALSPRLEELDIFVANTSVLDTLVLDQTSLNPTAAKLKKMTLRSADRGGELEILDGAAFMQMFKSRMGALDGADPEVFQPLEEIRFVWEDDEMLHMQLTLFETTEREATLTAEEDEEGFPFRQLTSKLRLDLRTKLVRHMRELEGAKLTEGSSLVLMVGGTSKLDAKLSAYHAKTLRAQTRLFETLDVLDEMERTHAEQLALNERREGRLKQKMKMYAEVARKAGEEMDDMQQAVLKLVDKVEKHNGYKSIKPSQLHVSSLLDPIEPIMPRRVSPTDVEDLLSYAASMIEVVRRERAMERKAHQKTKEWAQSRIATLEAQLSRREIELARCATHCFSSRDAAPAAASLQDEPVPHQHYVDTLQWTIAKNRTLELEINALSEKLTEVRLKEGKPQDESLISHVSDVDHTPARSHHSSVAGLGQQIQELGQLIDTLKEDRASWRSAIDSEKLSLQKLPETFVNRLQTVEEECDRLRRSEEDLRRQLDQLHLQDQARESELRDKLQLLDTRISAITTNNVTQDGDTIRVPEPQHSTPKSPPQDLLDDGEVSMDLETPLIPTMIMEPPSPPLEPFDSPDPVPQRPSQSPSPITLSPLADPPSIPLPETPPSPEFG
ncbi:hypothetical protein EST38_g6011 [Candolleomyces aberdarensis]|uniref:F-box domain-containing protein n=1 Tax=Candolleomyces aberdarensis TaxID=2316362 RepID=A0A4V1Q3V0_9AGAR|nr:hypothetical protein EST38_g6011 [Candolleomyces aberdarensis]